MTASHWLDRQGFVAKGRVALKFVSLDWHKMRAETLLLAYTYSHKETRLKTP